MKLGLKDLHPSVADVLRARVWSLRVGPNQRPEDAEARSVLGRRWKGWGWRILAALPIGAALGVSIVAASGGHGGQMAGAGFLGAYFSGIATGVGSLIASRLGRNTAVSADELRALASGLQLGRPETLYLDTVCALAEAGDNVGDETGRDILATLNLLLEQARYVDVRLDRLRSAASTDSVQDLEEDRERLASRVANVQDPQAREDLTQSLAMCDNRLSNARALAPLIERLDAQREVIDQTLLSVQSSVSRLQVAPTALAAPAVEEVKRVVSQVTAQTHAVEDAVQQVMALRP
jgi:hypothetical protein